ncbi:MAG TPA: hypothetical protein VGE90_05030 [Chitinophaga sp.]
MLIICAGIAACEKEEHISAAPQVSTVMIPMRDTLPPVIAENTLLTNTHPWYIAGWVYVSNEATLTIEPGTIIKITGKEDTGAGLVITRGAKIMARGLNDWPILFQLNNDTRSWSGIVLLGKAPQKTPYPNSAWAYGGELPDDSSGVLQHIRIVTNPCKNDVAGKQLQNGLLLLGAGRKTVVKDVVTDTSSNSPYRITITPLK